MYPWRLGLKAVYEYGEKGKSNRDDFLPQVPTVAVVFRDANYSTGHSGKWHVGGMRNDDLDMRILPNIGENVKGGKRCPHPGPNQQGFTNYVSVLDGPGAPRQNYLQINDVLYSKGCEYLLHNDKPAKNITGYLSHCEAKHAIKMMQQSVAENKPFYIQVWFHAPHGPWEEIPGYESLYPNMYLNNDKSKIPLCRSRGSNQRYCKIKRGEDWQVIDSGVQKMDKFRTMVTDMDYSVGLLLESLKTMGIEKNTLVAFLSDNGPEDFVGTTSGYRGNKRHIYEGGIRVPAIFQWIGTIPGGKNSSTFAISTDLFPTFVDAANLKMPTKVKVDGMSILSELIGRNKISKKKINLQIQEFNANLNSNSTSSSNATTTIVNSNLNSNTNMYKERAIFWHNDYEGPRKSAMWLFDFKIFLDEKELPCEMYDMKNDPFEKNNLLQSFPKHYWENLINKNNNMYLTNERNQNIKLNTLTSNKISYFHKHYLKNSKQLDGDEDLHFFYKSVVLRVFKALKEFALHGDEAYQIYLKKNPSRRYVPTIKSDTRHMLHNIYKKNSPQEVEKKRNEFLLQQSCDESSCECRMKSLDEVENYPFDLIAKNRSYLIPNGFFNATLLLNLV
jgi:arylsulfatase A-like enzyme